MSKQKMTYQERCQSVAKNLVGDKLYMEYVSEMVVAAQAEAIREAFRYMMPHHIDVDRYLLDYGYIEPKTEEVTQAKATEEICQKCKRRPATDRYSDLKVCSVCCDMLNDEFDEEYR